MTADAMRPSVERTCRAIFRLSALLDPFRLRLWDEAGLTVTQMRLLGFLNQEEGIGNAELAERLFITRPSVSALLDRLERGGYIRREISLNDRRSIRIWLTESGRTAVNQLNSAAFDFTGRMVESIGDEVLDEIAAAIEGLVAVAREQRASELMAEERAEANHR